MLHNQATIEQQQEVDAARLYEKVRMVRRLVTDMHDTLTEQSEQIREIEEGLEETTAKTRDLRARMSVAGKMVRRKGVLAIVGSVVGFAGLLLILSRI